LKKALEGIKIADFSWAVVGPLTTKYLADQGATVVKVESINRPDPIRLGAPYKDGVPGPDRAGYFAYINTNKYSVSLDLSHPLGLGVAKKLVAWADIVCENFSAGQMEKWGLGYDDLKEINPDIIMFRSAAQGQSGPHAKHPSYGIHLIALAGFTCMTGWADRYPNHTTVPYTDIITPRIGAAIVMAALDYRDKTSKGQCIDLSQLEVSSAYFTAPVLLDYIVNGRETERAGNSCPYAAPHGVYRCQGDDRWCAISVITDDEWDAFCEVIGNPLWSKEARFSTLLKRKQNEVELNQLIESWTLNHTAEAIMARMQKAGIAAGVVANAEDLLNDPQLKSRKYFQMLEHAEIGALSHPSPAFKLSKTPAELSTSGPILGYHTEYVCRELLGMSQDMFDELIVAGVFQ